MSTALTLRRRSAIEQTPVPHVASQVELRIGPPLRFVMIAFEGPDPYSHAGGLAVRVTNLAAALGETGAAVDLFFVGDPDRPPVESLGRVTLHRWCQPISAHAPAGVYDNEEGKVEDLCLSLPRAITDLVRHDRGRGIRTVVLGEEWQTAWPMVAIHEQLRDEGLRDGVTMAWTANNRFGFDRIDFDRLGDAVTILTVSRAMKHLMWGVGVNPLVLPNGLPDDAFEPAPAATTRALRAAFGERHLLTKVGRWDPDKRWPMAIDTVARLRDRGDGAVLLARGWNGSSAAGSYYRELRAFAADRRLDWSTCTESPDHPTDVAGVIERIAAAAPDGSGVLEVAFPIEGAALRSAYCAADAVLANSGFEPFGLVGLEAMAARSVVITGSTGEEYISPFRNGFALDTDQSDEIVRYLDWLHREPARSAALRRAAHATATTYRWPAISDRLHLALDLPEPANLVGI